MKITTNTTLHDRIVNLERQAARFDEIWQPEPGEILAGVFLGVQTPRIGF